MNLLESLRHDAPVRSWRERNRFVILLIGVIAISGVLVAIAMGLYNSGGAAQLDASAPRFQDVRDKIVQDKAIATFPAAGSFDKKSFDDFIKAYDESTSAISQVNGYDPAAVNNDSFNLLPTTPPVPGQ